MSRHRTAVSGVVEMSDHLALMPVMVQETLSVGRVAKLSSCQALSGTHIGTVVVVGHPPRRCSRVCRPRFVGRAGAHDGKIVFGATAFVAQSAAVLFAFVRPCLFGTSHTPVVAASRLYVSALLPVQPLTPTSKYSSWYAQYCVSRRHNRRRCIWAYRSVLPASWSTGQPGDAGAWSASRLPSMLVAVSRSKQ